MLIILSVCFSLFLSLEQIQLVDLWIQMWKKKNHEFCVIYEEIRKVANLA